MLDRPIEKLPRHFPRLTGVKLLFGSGQMWIYRLDATSPRVYLASRVIPVVSDTVLDQEELPEFERTSEALIDEESIGSLSHKGLATAPAVEPVPAGVARIADYQRNSVTIEVTADRAGVLVLHDIFYPVWEVLVDGQPRPLLRANLLFRGVEVTPGTHRVEFRFDPLSFDNLVAAASDLVSDDDEDRVALSTAR